MKLNDPFGRMARRREREYQSLRQSLINAGLTDRTKAEELIESLQNRSRKGLWILIPATAVLALLFREYAVYILAVGGLIILWLTNTMSRGSEYIRRYIEEECGGETSQEQPEAQPDVNELPSEPAQP